MGCHGAFLLRVLAGSGYKLFWSASISGRVVATPSTDPITSSSFQHTTLVTAVDANINTTITTTTWTHDCECVSSPQSDPAVVVEEAKMHNMIARINR